LKVAISILSLLPLTSGFHKIRQDAIYNNTAGTIEANLRLRQIQVVMRHGERTAPCYCPETDETVWKKEMTELSDEIPLPPYQFRNPATGEIVENPIDNENRRNGNKPKILKGGAIQFGLTRRGMEQCFKLGKAIRERYEDELPFDDKYFQENEIELFTSNFQRTKLSLAYVLAGVFPDYAQEPARKKNFTFNLLDGLLTRDHLKNSVTWKNWKRFCETYADDLVQGYQQSSEMIASLCKIKGKPPYWLLSGVTDLMVAWKANRLNEDQSQPKNEMASGLLDVLPDLEVKSHRLHQAKYIGDSRFGIDLKNLTAKPLLTKIISNMRRRTEGLTDKKMIFYSGHDVTLIPLLHAIGIPPETTLPLGASLTFELYQETSAYCSWTIEPGICPLPGPLFKTDDFWGWLVACSTAFTCIWRPKDLAFEIYG